MFTFTLGCGGGDGTTVLDVSEMEKYKSTPEELARMEQEKLEKMKGPSRQDVQEMARQAMESAGQ